MMTSIGRRTGIILSLHLSCVNYILQKGRKILRPYNAVLFLLIYCSAFAFSSSALVSHSALPSHLLTISVYRSFLLLISSIDALQQFSSFVMAEPAMLIPMSVGD